jgi:hypothetical protein
LQKEYVLLQKEYVLIAGKILPQDKPKSGRHFAHFLRHFLNEFM